MKGFMVLIIVLLLMLVFFSWIIVLRVVWVVWGMVFLFVGFLLLSIVLMVVSIVFYNVFEVFLVCLDYVELVVLRVVVVLVLFLFICCVLVRVVWDLCVMLILWLLLLVIELRWFNLLLCFDNFVVIIFRVLMIMFVRFWEVWDFGLVIMICLIFWGSGVVLKFIWLIVLCWYVGVLYVVNYNGLMMLLSYIRVREILVMLRLVINFFICGLIIVRLVFLRWWLMLFYSMKSFLYLVLFSLLMIGIIWVLGFLGWLVSNLLMSMVVILFVVFKVLLWMLGLLWIFMFMFIWFVLIWNRGLLVFGKV